MKIFIITVGVLWASSAFIIPALALIRKIHEKRGVKYVFKIPLKEWVFVCLLELAIAAMILNVGFRM